MVIGVNTRLLIKDKLEGIGWFAQETLRRMVQLNPSCKFIFYFDRPFDDSFLFGENVIGRVLYPPARHPVLYKVWLDVVLKRALKKDGVTVFFSPDGFIPLGLSIPVVNVIHDIAHVHHPDLLDAAHRWYYSRYMHRFAHASSQLVTVSEYSKTDIAKTYDVDKSRVSVVYNGVRDGFRPQTIAQQINIRDSYTLGAPYFIYVGSLNARKNLVRLIEAFEVFKKQYRTDVKLILVGKPMGDNNDLFNAINVSSVKADIIRFDYLPDDTLIKLLGASIGLCYVSLFEGFGVPIVEAMHCEVPVITSDVTAMPEVAGKAALLVDPLSVNSIAKAMEQLSTNDALRRALVEAAREQRQLFTWDNAAQRLFQIIENAVWQE